MTTKMRVVMTMPHTDLAKMYYFVRGCRGRDRMIVGFTTTYAISAYRH